MLNTQCQCSLPPNHVFDGDFTCDEKRPQNIIYRAQLRGNDANDCSNLTGYLRTWVTGSASIKVQGNRLKLDPTCDLVIDNLLVFPACQGNTTMTPTTDRRKNEELPLPIIAGAAAGLAFIILLLLFLVILVCCCICRNRRK